MKSKSDKNFSSLKKLVDYVTKKGGVLNEVQGRNCLIAPAGFLFYLINSTQQRIIYTGAGLCIENEQDCILVPAGTLLTTNEKGVNTYSTNFIKPVSLSSIQVELVPN